jgi:mono/diheme cytochrome c family protein
MRLFPAFVAGAVVALGASAALAADGQRLFLDNCAACHRPNGMGVPGAFPALNGSKIALGDPKEPIGRVLMGKGGMPSFQSELSDGDIAAVLTYVRGAWTNKAKPITAAQVAAQHGGAKSENLKGKLQAH